MDVHGSPREDDSLRAGLRRFLAELRPPATRLIVAVSGGPDSSALLHALVRAEEPRPDCTAVHVNHHLRGDASKEDESWVRAFAAQLGVPLTVLDGSLDPERVRAEGLEAAARAVRYRLLAAERDRTGCDWVATGHSRSDQAETLLLRLITGRGTWRLSGIRPITENRVIRPLLRVSREGVRRYLQEHGIEPRHDASNDDSRFLRNRIRHELLPRIVEWNPRIEEILADTAALELDRAAAEKLLMEPVRRDLVSESDSSSAIAIPPDLSPHLVRALALEQIRRLDASTREVDAAALASLSNLMDGCSLALTPRLRATRESGSIRIELVAPESVPQPFAHAIEPGETVPIPEARVVVSLLDCGSEGELVSRDRMRQVIQLQPGSPERFVVRNRRAGDRFRPLGMDRDKNLADFLIDRRIPVAERDSLPLLVCNDMIAWVAGVEVSDQFKVGPGDGRRLEIVARPAGG